MIKSKISPKGDPYLTHTMQHLLYMASGVFPGFSPVKNDELLPKTFIQEAYLGVSLNDQKVIWKNLKKMLDTKYPVVFYDT